MKGVDGGFESMVGSSVYARAADRLIRAARDGIPCQPVRDLLGAGDAKGAYKVQRLVNRDRVTRGSRPVGHKIGLTSPAVQEQLGVGEPDFGVLFDDMAFSDGDDVPIGRLIQPRVEAEVAFVLGDDLASERLDMPTVRAAVDYCVAALEIVDSRIEAWDISLADTIADNGSAGLFVVGSERKYLDDFDPVDVVMTMSVDDEVVSSGTGSACLGDPLLALLWLARTAQGVGEPLRAGQFVLSGALGPMYPIRAGSKVTADLAGIGAVGMTCSNHDGF